MKTPAALSPPRRTLALAIALAGFGLAFASWPARSAPPVVTTIPWVAANPLIPHDTWSGRVIRLKGTCDVEGPSIQYYWDFGDGSPVASGTVVNRLAVEASHTYVGLAGTVFSATLAVEDTNTGQSGSARYYVRIQDRSLAVEVNVTIDEGLWWLFKSAERLPGGQYRWNNVRYGNHWANATASAVQAFEVNGHLETQLGNPYADAVRGGIDYLATVLYTQTLGLQGGENPDSNGNGIGLSVNSDRPIYETGAVMDALVASGTPDARARTGGANVLNRRYQDLVQDMVDMYAWGQVDSGNALGGWQYSWNGGSDNSAAQWGAIGMVAAERHFGCFVPAWVKVRNNQWLNRSYNGGGWFGYENTSANRELSTGPCGMVQLAFDEFDVFDPRWVNCERYLANNWNAFISLGRDTRYYSYYAFTKAMRTALPQPVTLLAANGLDWYGDNDRGLARLLVNSQAGDGSWAYDGWPYVGERTAAAWNIIILSRTLFQSGTPVAVAGANPNPAVAGQIVTLDGTASFHQDPGKMIDSWQWDFGNDGTIDAIGPFTSLSFGAVGNYPVRLIVTDNGIPELEAETIVTIVVSTPPLPPTADAGGPYVFCPGAMPWFLDGSGSLNPDEGQSEPGRPGDTIVAFEWDLDGDGQFDDALGPQPDVTGFFAGLGWGSYLVQVRVTDRTATSFPSSGFGDLSDTDSAVVTVRSDTDPECSCVDDLVARAKPGKVQLVWTHTGAHHYNVYRSTIAGGPYALIAATTSTYSTYLDQGVANGTTYHYVVREADFLNRETCQSNEAVARPVARR